MQSDALLTQDELDFIQTMQHNPQLNVRDATASLLVNGGVQIKDLLTRLVAQDHVTIQAQFENQQISFPLQLVEDEFHAQHIKLGAPTIYEDGPMIRPWRLTLATPVSLQSDDGKPTGLWARELSFNGMLIEARDRAAPLVLSAWFAPDGFSAMAMKGKRQRKTADGLFAYRLQENTAQETERLRQFILQQHQLSHPQLHA
ncbi:MULTISPECIES: hypothetical protein [Pseudomonas]|jgi:hypothetical protein|uniref:hypothetical protein n=1 Tax=Pseudomonas TaxID=286 RepID=UPI001CFAE40F|nr:MULTISPECIES: hypothetical protein [Pseudomonas]